MKRLATVIAVALLGLVALAAPARAETLEEVFRAGNDAYFRGDFAAAVERYESLVELGVRDADVFYNLGTAYARQGRNGQAIAAYERALRVRPGDAEAETALQRTRDALAARRAEREGEATMAGDGVARAVFGRASRETLALLVLVLDALFFAALAAFLFARRETVRLALGVTAPLLGIGLAVSALGLAIRSGVFDDGVPAVVVRDRAALREGPREDAQERARAREGERAWVLAEDGEWARVRVGGREGWIGREEIVRVE